MPAPSSWVYDLLRDVSRSFYLTVRVLPGAVRPQIGLAYLLARATDTIADTEIIPVAERLEALGCLRSRILGATTAPLDFRRFAAQAPGPAPAGATSPAAGALAAERRLLERIEPVLAVLIGFPPDDQERIRAVLSTIASGQELDLRRFGRERRAAGAPPPALPTVVALQTDAELEDYTHRVAGCVGEFWTKMCRAHLFPSARLDEPRLVELGIRFGKGLQLVNILRDLPRDLRLGRCYLPAERLAVCGLSPASLLDPACLERFRPCYVEYVDRAAGYLADGWAYTNALPRGQMRVRLACAWSILIGIKTLARLRAGPVLDPEQRIKISRAEVRQLLVLSLLCYPWSAAWNGLPDRARK
jgi:farnesyl-diphosphate farnesyltransferase